MLGIKMVGDLLIYYLLCYDDFVFIDLIVVKDK